MNLELKSTITEMKNSLEGFYSRYEQAGERISKLEDRTIGFMLRSRKKKE